MKIFSLLIISLILSTGLFAQGQIEFKNKKVTLKNLKADEQPVTEKFQVKNTGNQPVIITRISPMTSQIKADWNREPIAPGKSGEVRLTFTPQNMPETFDYKVLVYSNARNNREELVISGNIIDNPAKPTLLYKHNMDGLKFKNGNIALNKIYSWQVLADTIYYYNTRPEAVTLGIQYKPAHIGASFVPEKVEPGKKGAIIVTFDAPKKNDYGYNYESLILSVNNSKDYKNRLTITSNIVEDFSKLSKRELANAPVASFEKTEINFGEIKKGDKTNCDFKLTNTGKSTLFIRKTKASCGCTAITLGNKAIEPGQTIPIRATFDSTGKSGRQYKTVTVITNDPQKPEILLNLNGNVIEK